MKDKEKQIEEMAKGICFNTCKYCENCYFLKLAEILYNAGYRKLPKDSVVLSKEEYSKNLQTHYYMGLREIETEYKTIQIPKERKEMVEKILVKIKQSLNSVETIRGDDTNKLQPDIGYSMREVDDLLDELAKQFGVEIKES